MFSSMMNPMGIPTPQQLVSETKKKLEKNNYHTILQKFIDVIDNPCAFRALLGTLNYNGYCALKTLIDKHCDIPVIVDIVARAHDLYFDRYRPFRIIVTDELIYSFPDGIEELHRARVIERVQPGPYDLHYFVSTTEFGSSYVIHFDKKIGEHEYVFDCVGHLHLIFGAFDRIVSVIVAHNYCSFRVEYI